MAKDNRNNLKPQNAGKKEKMESSNMSYRYYVEYLDRINDRNAADVNRALLEAPIFPSETMFQELKEDEDYCSFCLDTAYPGLLMGIGNFHDISAPGAYKLGFSFDYVNGLPYLPGSSLKGILRSVFLGVRNEKQEGNQGEYENYLRSALEGLDIKNIDTIDLEALEKDIFEFNDVFLGAYPEKAEDGNYMAEEFITPHKKLKNPNPISFLKVKPGVCFRFSFLLYDGKYLTKEEKCKLFQRLILDFGVGAKTNVGFGKFVLNEE